MAFIKQYVIVTVFFYCIIGCSKTKFEPETTADQMVLIYMAANNDLRLDALECLNRIESGYSGGNDLLVYIKTTSEHSFLLKIKHDNTNQIVSDTLMTYGNENSSDPEFLKRVVNDSRRISSASTYGLILWSHASSWAPSNEIRLKSFGEDRGTDMDIKDLKNALPRDFLYIIFDACSIASIEAIYELRNNAQYILASPTEVLSTSYPYEDIIPDLFGGKDRLNIVAEKFIAYYRSLPGQYASATVSLVATDELELLAAKTKELLDLKRPKKYAELNGIQRLDFDPAARVPAYDFLDFLEQNFEEQDYRTVLHHLNNAVLFKDHTSDFLHSRILKFSGLSIYLPSERSEYKEYYRTLDWYQSGGSYNLFME